MSNCENARNEHYRNEENFYEQINNKNKQLKTKQNEKTFTNYNCSIIN